MEDPSYNMLIPMAGSGTRFAEVGYTLPKPLLDMHGKSMIHRVIENLYDPRLRFIFCVKDDHIRDFNLATTLCNLAPNCHIITTGLVTQGPVSTCMLAKELVDNNMPLFITNSDQIIEDWDLDTFLSYCNDKNPDGVVGTFDSQSPKNSYIRLNDKGEGLELKEKEVISEHATNGLHYWKHGSMFVNASTQMIQNGDTTNDEYYVAPTYNYMINEGMKITTYKFNYHYPIGIPTDFDLYLKRLESANII